jgi:hypothetical protein
MKTEEEKKKHAAYMREYYKADPVRREKKRQKDREYAAKNRESALARATSYYEQNTEQVKRYQADRRRDSKAKAAALLGGVCQRCGFEHLAALDFHHIDPSLKEFRLSDALVRTKKYTWEEIVEEVMKCELLCKNCHAIEHCTWEQE